jgi:hypothetical protein
MRNLYFSDQVKSEQNLYENIIIESLKIYGQDVYYLPRTLVNEDRIFGDDVPSQFNSSYKIEMYIENIEGFDGEGDLFSRFGVEIRDEATFVVARKRWSQTIGKYQNEISSVRPNEGDLIYLPLTKKLFQINHVEHEQPFYQLGNLPLYKMRCQLFEYNDENLDTGVDTIDAIERANAYEYILNLNATSVANRIGDTATQILDSASGLQMVGEVSRWSDSDQNLHLIHIGANDGKYHEFVTSRPITISGDSRADSDFTILTITENNKISNNEQNNDFSDLSDDFLDFTEDNPFGDAENN